MTEKWGQIQGKWDLVRVSGGVRVIRVRVTGVLLQFHWRQKPEVAHVYAMFVWKIFETPADCFLEMLLDQEIQVEHNIT